jgi:chromate reductase
MRRAIVHQRVGPPEVRIERKSSLTLKILGIAGSLRRGSLNAMALRAAQRLVPEGVTIDIFDRLREIPPYDDDERVSVGFPPAADALREGLRAADALLIASPEYNYSIPGQLKNAIDWASRAPDQPFADKPVAIMGASPGLLGTARMQYHLRQCFVFLDARVLSKPEVMIGQAAQKFDAEGNLADDATANIIAALLTALAAWTERLRP